MIPNFNQEQRSASAHVKKPKKNPVPFAALHCTFGVGFIMDELYPQSKEGVNKKTGSNPPSFISLLYSPTFPGKKALGL